jgi:predicted nucleic acid-binding protein
VAGLYTVDASVFVNAFNAGERGGEQSRRFLTAAQQGGATVVVPTLLVPEVGGAITRGRQDQALARLLSLDIAGLSMVNLVAVDRALSGEARDIAVEWRLRGADSVYAAVALRFNAVLVTRDREQQERLAEILTVRSPEEALAELGV